MYRSIYFKIILIFVVFIITVMAVVSTVLLNGVFRFYTSDFVSQVEKYLGEDAPLRQELAGVMTDDDFPAKQKEIISAYSSPLGIDPYRNYYILDIDGNWLDGSNEELGRVLVKSPNMLAAMKGRNGSDQPLGSEYSDYAFQLQNDGRKCIVYIKDTQEEMRQLNWQLFSIILQTILIGLGIAIILSFFLAKAITSPIQSLTRGAKLITAGEFSHEIDVHAKDEIGILTTTFNQMKIVLKNTLDEVSGERQKLETILSYLKDAVIAFSERGRIIHINKSAIELFGSKYREHLTLDELLILFNIEHCKSYISELSSDKSYTLRSIEYDGRALDINFSLLKYIEDNRVHDGCIAVIHDITSRYELDKAQREFVANVSHELRTPLTVIKSSVESVMIYPDMSDEIRDTFLGNTLEECDRMMRIIGDLLTLSRLDNKKTKWQITTFNLKQSIERICDMMQSDARAHGHTLSCEMSADFPWISADKERVEQVIINILSNAIKYTSDNGEIILKANPIGDEVAIKVKDNGIGIPKDDLPRLFERFYRVEKARTSDTGGTGLGLAIAKEIVEAHGGRIKIASEINTGTEVTIILPITTKLDNN